MVQAYLPPEKCAKGYGIPTANQPGDIAVLMGTTGAPPYSIEDTTKETGTPEITTHIRNEKPPTYNPMSLDEAVDYFQGNYIPLVSKYIGENRIYHLAGQDALGYNRPGLSTIINELGIKDAIERVKSEERYGVNALGIVDPIVRRVFEEATQARNYLPPNSLALQGYDLHFWTERFKEIYVNDLAEEKGVKKAAEILGKSESFVAKKKSAYRANKLNDLVLSGDWVDVMGNRDSDDGANLEPDSIGSLSKIVAKEEEIWKQMQQQ